MKINKWKYLPIVAFCFVTTLCSEGQGIDNSERASQSSEALYKSQIQENSFTSQARLVELQEIGVESQRSWSPYLSSYLWTPIKTGLGVISSSVNFTRRNPGTVIIMALLATSTVFYAKFIAPSTSAKSALWCVAPNEFCLENRDCCNGDCTKASSKCADPFPKKEEYHVHFPEPPKSEIGEIGKRPGWGH